MEFSIWTFFILLQQMTVKANGAIFAIRYHMQNLQRNGLPNGDWEILYVQNAAGKLPRWVNQIGDNAMDIGMFAALKKCG